MSLCKRLFFIILVFQSELYCSSFLKFFNRAPETLNSDFFSGKLKLTDLFQQTLNRIANVQEKEAIIVKMNQYLRSCNQRQKELFIEILNQTIPKGILTAQQFARHLDHTVDQSISLHETYKRHNWLSELNNTQSVTVAKESDFNNLKSKLSILFESALSGNERALGLIKNLVAANEMDKLSDEQKRDVLILLQDKTNQYLQHVNETAVHKNAQLMSDDSDMDSLPPKLQEVSSAQTANARAVFKYSKDIFEELKPLCTSSQRLIYSIDRQNINPVINIVDMKHLRLAHVESLHDLPGALEGEAERLQAAGSLQIPLHAESRPIFMSELKDKVLGYNRGYVEHQANTTYEKFKTASDDDKKEIIRDHYHNRPSYEPGFITEQIHHRLSERMAERG